MGAALTVGPARVTVVPLVDATMLWRAAVRAARGLASARGVTGAVEPACATTITRAC